MKNKLFFIYLIFFMLTSCTDDGLQPLTELNGSWTGKNGTELVISNGKVTSFTATDPQWYTALCGEIRLIKDNIYAYRGNECHGGSLTIMILSASGNSLAIAQSSSDSHLYAPYGTSPVDLLEKNTATLTSTYTAIDKAFSWQGSAVFVDGNIAPAADGEFTGQHNVAAYTNPKTVTCTTTDCTANVSGFSRTSHANYEDITTATQYSGNATFDNLTEAPIGTWNGIFTAADAQLGPIGAGSSTMMMSEDKQFAVFKVCHIAQITSTNTESCTGTTPGTLRCDGIKMNNNYNAFELSQFLADDALYPLNGASCAANSDGDTFCDNVSVAQIGSSYASIFQGPISDYLYSAPDSNSYSTLFRQATNPMNYGCDVIAGERL